MYAIHILDEFGNDCPIFTKDLTECDEIYVEYNGKDVVSPCNKFKFRGRGKEILDEYSICVTPLNFNDRTCAVEVDIITSLSEVATKVCMHAHLTLKEILIHMVLNYKMAFSTNCDTPNNSYFLIQDP